MGLTGARLVRQIPWTRVFYTCQQMMSIGIIEGLFVTRFAESPADQPSSLCAQARNKLTAQPQSIETQHLRRPTDQLRLRRRAALSANVSPPTKPASQRSRP